MDFYGTLGLGAHFTPSPRVLTLEVRKNLLKNPRTLS